MAAEKTNWWSDFTGAIGDIWSGVSGTASDILNSDAATAYIDEQAQLSAQEFAADQARKDAAAKAKNTLPPWAILGGIGLAVVLIIVLIISMARRR